MTQKCHFKSSQYTKFHSHITFPYFKKMTQRKFPGELYYELLETKHFPNVLASIIDEYYQDDKTYTVEIYSPDSHEHTEYILRKSESFIFGVSLVSIIKYYDRAPEYVQIDPVPLLFDPHAKDADKNFRVFNKNMYFHYVVTTPVVLYWSDVPLEYRDHIYKISSNEDQLKYISQFNPKKYYVEVIIGVSGFRNATIKAGSDIDIVKGAIWMLKKLNIKYKIYSNGYIIYNV